ncbi:MAG: hypothetical protein U9N86_12450, partial [Bacteroidota bacterium]|nr:hypothetical protein [Bacteroidota bacterium]
EGSGLKAQGSRLRAQGSGLRAQGSGLRAQGGGSDGLILVDLLSLRSKFSWARYRVDIIGFTVAVLIVGLLLLLMIFLAGLGG